MAFWPFSSPSINFHFGHADARLFVGKVFVELVSGEFAAFRHGLNLLGSVDFCVVLQVDGHRLRSLCVGCFDRLCRSQSVGLHVTIFFIPKADKNYFLGGEFAVGVERQGLPGLAREI